MPAPLEDIGILRVDPLEDRRGIGQHRLPAELQHLQPAAAHEQKLDRTISRDPQGIETHRHAFGDRHGPALTAEGRRRFRGRAVAGRGGRQRWRGVGPVLQGGRLAIQPTLGFLPAELPQGRRLSHRFHPLSHRGQTQALRQAGQGLG